MTGEAMELITIEDWEFFLNEKNIDDAIQSFLNSKDEYII
jgi:hypothetical protein